MIVQGRTHITESKCAPWSFSISNIFRSSLIPCVENDLYTANQIVKLSPNKVSLFSKQRLKKSAVSLIAHQFTHSKNRGIHRERKRLKEEYLKNLENGNDWPSLDRDRGIFIQASIHKIHPVFLQMEIRVSKKIWYSQLPFWGESVVIYTDIMSCLGRLKNLLISKYFQVHFLNK